MIKLYKHFKQNFSSWAIGSFWLVDLVNPVFKKYDYGAEYPLVLAFGVLILILAIVEFKKQREKNHLEEGFLLIFAGGFITSFILSQTKNVGFSEVLAYLMMVPLYFIFAGQNFMQKKEWRNKIFNIVAIGTLIAVLMGFVQYLFWPENRMFGPFFNILYHANVWPNAFALFLLMTWPIFLSDDLKIKSGFRIAALSLVLSALLLTFSRGALIAFVGQLVLLGIFYFKRINLKVFGGLILTAFIAVGIFFASNYVRSLQYKVINVEERVNFENSEGLTSKKERQDFWEGAVELTKDRPWFGWGPFSFRDAYNPIQEDLLANSDHPHSIFLKFAAENGLVTAGAFAMFLVSLLLMVVKRFKNLDAGQKSTVYLLTIAIAGGFAHNMIDYNFNFLNNLLLLFVYLILLRSLLVKKVLKRSGQSFLALILATIIALVSLYEGSLLVMEKMVYDKTFANESLFPRNAYLDSAQANMENEMYDFALVDLQKQLELNPLDAQALHLKAVIYCDKDYEKMDYKKCNDLMEEALDLNPLNSLSYYVDFLRPVADGNLNIEKKELNLVLIEAEKILNIYFEYVENNVHFTAYTSNVESASELTDLLIKLAAFDSEKIAELKIKKQKMIEEADKLRREKSF
ncbi:MAG: O-antigen ligase family protein [Patescibacteria group bacterium]